MKKASSTPQDEIRTEYDLHQLRIRRVGPDRKRFGEFVRLAPDVAQIFPDADAVNDALRYVIRITEERKQANPSINT